MRKKSRDPFACQHSEQLLQVVRLIHELPQKKLRQQDVVADLIRQAGLSYDPRGIYGEDNSYMNESRFGLWQQPQQLAAALCWLSQFRIQRALEIGTFKGWTTTVLGSYLRRFNPELKLITIDPVRQFYDYPVWKELGISYQETDSSTFAGQQFDLCFIDGDHSYSSLKADYENTGRIANICMIHDINEELCPDVERFWKELKERSPNQTYEFMEHPDGFKVMGIGAVLQNDIRQI
jgi:hypothetical protein